MAYAMLKRWWAGESEDEGIKKVASEESPVKYGAFISLQDRDHFNMKSEREVMV